jgi:hypothetical protein
MTSLDMGVVSSALPIHKPGAGDGLAYFSLMAKY